MTRNGWILIGVIAAIAIGVQISKQDEEDKGPTLPLDFTKPIYTIDSAILCPLLELGDVRAGRGLQGVRDLFTSIVNRNSKAQALGCEVWQGGTQVFANPMPGQLSEFIQVGRLSDERLLFTAPSHLTNFLTDIAKWQAMGALALDRKEYGSAIRWYSQAADKGDGTSQYYIGTIFQSGLGVPQDYAAAQKWYELASHNGSAPALYNLGILYELGAGTTKNLAVAKELYTEAAKLGVFEAQEALEDLAASSN